MSKEQITTCEQYVLDLLKQEQRHNIDLFEQKLSLEETINELKAKIRDFDNGDYHVTTDYENLIEQIKEILEVK